MHELDQLEAELQQQQKNIMEQRALWFWSSDATTLTEQGRKRLIEMVKQKQIVGPSAAGSNIMLARTGHILRFTFESRQYFQNDLECHKYTLPPLPKGSQIYHATCSHSLWCETELYSQSGICEVRSTDNGVVIRFLVSNVHNGERDSRQPKSTISIELHVC